MAINAKMIEPGTYRVGDYVAFKTIRKDWKMGKPVDWDDPLMAGLIAGTVSFHPTLRDCVSRVRIRDRAKRGVRRDNSYKSLLRE